MTSASAADGLLWESLPIDVQSAIARLAQDGVLMFKGKALGMTAEAVETARECSYSDGHADGYDHGYDHGHSRGYDAALIEVEKERDALRKDAARLDWLEMRQSYSVSNLGGMSCAHLYVSSGNDVRVTMSLTRPTLRAAIDAALAVQPTTEGL